MPAVKGDGMRGLAVFISDIRNCKSREAEVKRINKELANIRSKFKGDKTLDGYQKKKYVCKLLFIFLLGHDIDFGHMEAVNLLSSNKYTEKQIGYLFISVLVSANSELMKLVIQSIKTDLASRNPVHVCLALQCIANIGSREMAEAFGQDIPKLLVSGDTIDSVKQSAALCLLRLIRASPDVVQMSEWSSRIIHLLNDQHMGVVTAAVSLIESLTKKNPDDYKGCVSLAVSRLSRIVTSSYTDLQDYTYYFVPAPWLSVKLLRLLQYYPPPDDAAVKNRLTECLETILNKAQEPPKSKKVQHSNAKNAVLFEAINLIIHMDSDPNLLVRACNQLGQFLQHRETNLRYLALESMCLLATSEFSHDAVKKHQETVITALKTERDVSVRQRAVDLLYAMCDRSNATEIVSEMLSYLETADYSIREEMVLKVAILAEKYAVDYTWYVDTILNLIRIAGDYVSEEVWYRVIQIVINRDDVQGYAAKTVFEALQAPACHENMVKVGGYILGEFGNLIAGDPRSSPMVQFQLLHSKFHLCSVATRGLLLSTYIKFVNLFPEIKNHVQEVLKNDNQIRNADVELQQRAVEYLQLSTVATVDVLATVLEEMPPFPERESSILAKLKKKRPEKIKEIELKDREPRPVAHINNNSQPVVAQVAPPSGGSTDLLGLSSSTGRPSAPITNSLGTLIDIMGDLGGESTTDPVSQPAAPANVANAFNSMGNTSHSEENFNNLTLTMTEPAPGFLPHQPPPLQQQEPGGLSDLFGPAQPQQADILDLGVALGGGGGGGVGAMPGGQPPTYQSLSLDAPLFNLSPQPDMQYPDNESDPLSHDSTAKLTCKNNGVMFENDLLQIGLKSEFRHNLGRLCLYYGNKTTFPFTGFVTEVGAGKLLHGELSVQAKEVDDVISGGAQKQQLINAECVEPFNTYPELHLRYSYSGCEQKISVTLPLTLNKFLEAADMLAGTFFERWKLLSVPTQECQRIFKAKFPMETEMVRLKLVGFGMSALDGVDPNPDNFVCASVLHTKSQQIGCLLRLEPNKQALMYRLTIRTSKDGVADTFCDLLETQL